MDTLLQVGTGYHQEVLAITEARHARLTEKHGLSYLVRSGSVARSWPRHPNWEKMHLIRANLSVMQDGETLIYLDADTLWERGDVDLRSALQKDCDIGMVRNSAGQFNAGAIWIRKSDETQKLFDLTWFSGPDPAWPHDDQTRLNQCMAAYPDLRIAELNPIWNCYKNAAPVPEGSAIIRAWHGVPFQDRLQQMRKTIARIHPL